MHCYVATVHARKMEVCLSILLVVVGLYAWSFSVRHMHEALETHEVHT
jgi:hypothetical protein